MFNYSKVPVFSIYGPFKKEPGGTVSSVDTGLRQPPKKMGNRRKCVIRYGQEGPTEGSG